MMRAEGSVGGRELGSIAVIGCITGGLFGFRPDRMFENGNTSYLVTALSAGIALVIASLIANAMAATDSDNLGTLYRRAFGGLSFLAGLVTALALLLSAVFPLVQLTDAMQRFVYTESDAAMLVLYLLACVAVLSVMGLEVIGRTSVVFLPPVLLSVLAVLLVSAQSFDVLRLYPLFSGSFRSLLMQSVRDIPAFLSPMLALLTVSRGGHGTAYTFRSGMRGFLVAAVLSAAMLIGLGMSYPAPMLADMRVPMYRMAMSVQVGSAYQRLDKLLLHLWMLAALLYAGFAAYASALLYFDTTPIRDVRPIAAVFAGLTTCGVLYTLTREQVTDTLYSSIGDYLFLPLIMVPIAACVLAAIRLRRYA